MMTAPSIRIWFTITMNVVTQQIRILGFSDTKKKARRHHTRVMLDPQFDPVRTFKLTGSNIQMVAQEMMEWMGAHGVHETHLDMLTRDTLKLVVNSLKPKEDDDAPE